MNKELMKMMIEAIELGDTSDFQWVTVTTTYTTDSTAAPQQASGAYSDGFNDGWNAKEVSQ